MMELDSKFGNIDLYLWQVRCNIEKNMRHLGGHDILFISYEYFIRSAFAQMLNFLLRRFCRKEYHQLVTCDELCRTLSDNGLEFTASSAWFNGRKVSEAKFSGIGVRFSINSTRTVISVNLPSCPQSLELHASRFMVKGDALLESLLMVEALGERISEMVREEYASRLAKSRSNRIRRIAAKHRRHVH